MKIDREKTRALFEERCISVAGWQRKKNLPSFRQFLYGFFTPSSEMEAQYKKALKEDGLLLLAKGNKAA